MPFTIFQNEKTPFQAIKTRSSTSRKNDILSKLLTHGFGTKMTIFPTSFFFRQYKPGKYLYHNLERKNAFLGYKNMKLKKSINLHFSKRVNPLFWSKNGHFSNFFFQAIQARKMSFNIFQNEKKAFQAIKTRTSKSRKFDIFPKGLTHAFGLKMAILPTFFFRQYRPGKCLIRYSSTKQRL